MSANDDVRHLSTVDCAKLVRAALKKAFPGTKFSVRSRSYSGGSSISVGWTDGPPQGAVAAVAKRFEGATFDGMTDSMSYHDPQEIDGEMVSLGVDFVSCQRRESDFDSLHAAALQIIRQRCTVEGAPGAERFGNYWIDTLASGMVHAADLREPAPLERAYRQVVLREER